MEKVLSRIQTELVASERRLVLAVRDALLRADAPPADAERLAALVHEMDELFLLVVVGEYNTGKSTFINALLGDEVFEMGDLPTTRDIAVLRFGRPGPPEDAGPHVRVYHYAAEFLHDLEIVDTPGTNSIERMEEAITREFVPRADLVLFVTSLLQPLTASELDFLSHIRAWGKKVVFVVNGVDRRNSDVQVDRVREYLGREVSTRLGGPPPTIYFVSALRALRAKRGGEPAPAADPLDAFPALEHYLLETLRERERVRLKLLSPLGVVRRLLAQNVEALETRLRVVQEDARVLRSIRDQLTAYGAEMRGDSERFLTDVRNVLYDLERRGRAWFDETVRITNLRLLRNRDAVANRFRTEVVADSPAAIEAVVHRMVDWMVRGNLRLWTAVVAELDAHAARLRASGALAPQGGTEFQYNREDLFARLRHPVDTRLSQFDAEREAQRVVAGVNESLAQTFGVQVLAVGLGSVVVAVFTTMALDVTGILTATLLAVAGWFILPARRRKMIRQLEDTVARLNNDLANLLSSSFSEQLERYERQMLEVVQPYERFLTTEHRKLDTALTELHAASEDARTLEARIEVAFPEVRA